VTSVAAMMLVERGELALDDPVSKYVPAFAELEVATFPEGQTLDAIELVPVETPMTVRHLITHTSGLIYGFFSSGPMAQLYAEAELWAPGNTLEDLVERVATLPLAAQPGERWTYSISTDVLGYVVQVASGRPLEEFLQQEVFEPLGMVDTGFHVPPGKQDRLVRCYYRRGGTIVGEDTEGRAAVLAPPALASGGGGLVSTLDDYARFCLMLAGDGEWNGVRLLEASTVAEMMTAPPAGSAADRGQPDGVGFGLGLLVVRDGARIRSRLATSQSSWGGLANTEFFVNPDQELFAVFMTQVLPYSNEFRRPFSDHVYDAVELDVPAATGD
jgi:CubicO group peptidase (beta-lactamase class C family)